MSKHITIQEGGIPRQMTVDKLRTPLVGGGTCRWVPEDEVTLGRKTIRENGTYLAYDDGLYGYSQVTVRGIGTATGKLPRGKTITGDGGDYTITTNPDTGEITFEKTYAYIEVTTPPTRTEYDPGDNLDFTGIVVTAFDSAGNSLVELPFSQLIFPKTSADGPTSGLHYQNAEGTVKAVALQLVTMITKWGQVSHLYPFALGADTSREGNPPMTIGWYEPECTAGDATILATYWNGRAQLARIDSNGGRFNDYKYSYIDDQWGFTGSTSYEVKYDQFGETSWPTYITADFIPASTVNPATVRPTALILTEGRLAVPVQWHRPGDGELLEATFEVTVHRSAEVEA